MAREPRDDRGAALVSALQRRPISTAAWVLDLPALTERQSGRGRPKGTRKWSTRALVALAERAAFHCEQPSARPKAVAQLLIDRYPDYRHIGANALCKQFPAAGAAWERAAALSRALLASAEARSKLLELIGLSRRFLEREQLIAREVERLRDEFWEGEDARRRGN